MLVICTPYLLFRHFPHIFVTYFYRGECTGLFYCHKIEAC